MGGTDCSACCHPGAVDEGEREQGIAHLVEHVTFLGSKKREGLLGTGARWAAGTHACMAGGALAGLLQGTCMLQLPEL